MSEDLDRVREHVRRHFAGVAAEPDDRLGVAQLTEDRADQEMPEQEPDATPMAIEDWAMDDTLNPSQELHDLSDVLWPAESIQFRVWAANLLQARQRHHLPIPQDPADPLVGDLASEVESALTTISSS